MTEIADCVEACITAYGLQCSCACVSIGSQMELLSPTLFGVQAAEEEHQEAAELPRFSGVSLFAAACFVKDRGSFGFRAGVGVARLHAVIREPATLIVKVLMALAQRLNKIGEAGNVDVCRRREPRGPFVKRFRISNRQCLIGAEGWKHSRGEARSLNASMMLERLDRIVGRANCNHAKLLENSLHREI